jgi:hypothetical protein
LRATPILFVLVYVARRQWRRVAETLVLTVVLVGPMLLYNPQTLVTQVPGKEPGFLSIPPILWVAVAVTVMAGATAFAFRRSRSTIAAAAAAAVLASPKLFLYDATTLLAVRPNGTSIGADLEASDAR